VTQLAAASYVESVRSDRALRLKLVAFGLLVVGDFAWFLLPPLNQDTWPDVLTIFGIWSAVAVLAWFSPLIGNPPDRRRWRAVRTEQPQDALP
jgi:hypothetical protein